MPARERALALRAEIEEHNHRYYVLDAPLLSDADGAMLAAYGAWGEKVMYGKPMLGIIRSTFVIDKQGVLRFAHYGVNAKGHAREMLRTVKELKQ